MSRRSLTAQWPSPARFRIRRHSRPRKLPPWNSAQHARLGAGLELRRAELEQRGAQASRELHAPGPAALRPRLVICADARAVDRDRAGRAVGVGPERDLPPGQGLRLGHPHAGVEQQEHGDRAAQVFGERRLDERGDVFRPLDRVRLAPAGPFPRSPRDGARPHPRGASELPPRSTQLRHRVVYDWTVEWREAREPATREGRAHVLLPGGRCTPRRCAPRCWCACSRASDRDMR